MDRPPHRRPGERDSTPKIESIVKPGALEEQYFPYTTVWRRAFRVRFPRFTGDGRPTIANTARWFGLRFAGAEGNGELRWKVQQTKAVAAFGPDDPAPMDPALH
jgi:hypothetical protein